MGNLQSKLHALPGMDILLGQDWVSEWLGKIGRDNVKNVLNEELAAERLRIRSSPDEDFSIDVFMKHCVEEFTRFLRPNLRSVVNASGVVIHTNLGRSLLADEAVNAMLTAAKHYTNLEYDLETGSRGHRYTHVEPLICSLTGAESALVVNNNAGAVLLCLSALAQNSEVVVSRGELVEIGGSFRIPDIMKLSGADLVEVGTTNRTHLYDYENAITDSTSMLLKVHPSNFTIKGFTTAPERNEIAELAHKHGLIFMEDAGSGLLIDSKIFDRETSIKSCLTQGVDLVTFSGDKLLGGPQLGIIAGRKDLIDRLKKCQLLRALRSDKITLAGFEATLRLYIRGAVDEIPTLEMIMRSDDVLKQEADNLAGMLAPIDCVEVIRVDDAVGGGSCPEMPLRGWGVCLKNSAHLQDTLRTLDLPVICNVHDDSLIIHVRTLRHGDAEYIAESLHTLMKKE